MAENVALPAEADNGFRDHDRWSAVGDSITHTGTYHAWVHLFYLTRFPALDLQVTNCGIAGDTAVGGLRRLNWDIRPTHPSVVTINFGMNDVGRSLYIAGTGGDNVAAQRRDAIGRLLKAETDLGIQLAKDGARVVLVTPSIFDDTADLAAPKLTGVDDALAQAADGMRKLAEANGWGLIDLHAPMRALNGSLQTADPMFTLTGPDRIHPGRDGHFAMAYFFLKAQAAPQFVSSLSLNASTLEITHATNGNLTGMEKTPQGLAFTWHEQALPFPVAPLFSRAATWVPFARELNQETLQISGLARGSYSLSIDGVPICVGTAEEFDAGVDLAMETKTPQYQQALQVGRLVEQYAYESAETVRNLALVEHQTTPENLLPADLAVVRPFLDAKFASFKTTIPSPNLLRIYHLYAVLKPAEDEHRSAIVALQQQARRLAQPRPHRYELIRVHSP